MVHDKIDGLEGVDSIRIASQVPDHVTHGRKIDDGGDTREILHQHARRTECDLLFGSLTGDRSGQRLNVLG